MWIGPDYSRSFADLRHTDPGGALTVGRTIKILRGLFRHPDRRVRLTACETLLHWGNAQDECWDQLELQDRSGTRAWRVFAVLVTNLPR